MKRKVLIGAVLVCSLVIIQMIGLWGGSLLAADRESALLRIQRAGVVRVGWAMWYPWTYIDEKTKKISGIAPDVIEELGKALGNVKVEWVADNWGTLVAGLQADKFDIIYPFGVTLPRAMAVEYSDDTMREAMTFLIKKKDAGRFKTFEDVDQPGVKVAAILGSNSELYVTKIFRKPEIVRFKLSPEWVMAVVLGKVDAYGCPGSQIVDAMKTHTELTAIKGSFALGKNCFAIRQGDQIFLNWLNLFVAEMKETGTLDRIFQKHGTKREIFFQ